MGGFFRTVVQPNKYILLLIFLVSVFAWTVWPTPYRYDRISTKDGSFPIRVHRITGSVEKLGLRGWKRTSPQFELSFPTALRKKEEAPAPAAEVLKTTDNNNQVIVVEVPDHNTTISFPPGTRPDEIERELQKKFPVK